jgi:hypothetical protein
MTTQVKQFFLSESDKIRHNLLGFGRIQPGLFESDGILPGRIDLYIFLFYQINMKKKLSNYYNNIPIRMHFSAE